MVRVVDLELAAEWVLPVVPRGSVLPQHSVLIDGERIVAVLPTATVGQRYAPRARIERPGHVLLPGLVNAHTHAAMTLMRGLADDLPLMTWLGEHIWPTEARHISPEFVRVGSEHAIAEMLLSGTTCFADQYFHPEVVADCAERLRVRAAVGAPVLEFPTPYARDADEYLAKGRALHAALAGARYARYAWAPHAPYTVADSTFAAIREHASRHGVRVYLHLHETASEIEPSLAEHGQRPFARIDRLGLIAADVTAVHMTQLTADEIARAAEAGLHVAHCPESNLKLASGICPVQALLDAGVNVALGTDGAASNNDLDLLGEARTAALVGKLARGHEATAVSAQTALELATIGGARALGLADELGSIEVGKAADLISIDLRNVHTQPLYALPSQLVYAASRAQIRDVYIGGQQRVSGGALVDIDLARILAESARVAAQVRG